MSDHNNAIETCGLGEWTPGAQEAARFREDLYLRIIGTAQTMARILARILDGRAETILSNLRKAAADGNLSEDREAVEMEAVSGSVEHSRFTYNWAHVTLTTRLLDFLKRLSAHLDDVRPKGEYPRRKAEFAARFGIEFSRFPSGDSFLEGMVLARNKIVHNGAMAWAASSRPDAILVEGAEDWSPSQTDQDFVARFAEYVDDDDRITVTETLFETNAERAMAFVTWVGEHLDSFVQLLKPSAGCSPS